jgi:hypothetical protein
LVEAVLRPEGRVRPRRGLVTASGWAALLTSAAAIWLAAELKIAGAGWLPWLACALPPAAAGGVCLARRPATSTGSAAVFASCIVAGAFVLQIPEGRHGLVLAASVFLLLCVGVSVIISATVTAVMISISGTVSPRRAVVWTAAALVFAAVSIPSPDDLRREYGWRERPGCRQPGTHCAAAGDRWTGLCPDSYCHSRGVAARGRRPATRLVRLPVQYHAFRRVVLRRLARVAGRRCGGARRGTRLVVCRSLAVPRTRSARALTSGHAIYSPDGLSLARIVWHDEREPGRSYS